MNEYLSVLKKWNNFSDRSGRREYWMFVLINFLIAIACNVIDYLIGIPVVGTIYSLALLIPGIAVTIRRLHDTDRSGWWILIAFIPFIGFIVLLVFLVRAGTPGPNRFGPPSGEQLIG